MIPCYRSLTDLSPVIYGKRIAPVSLYHNLRKNASRSYRVIRRLGGHIRSTGFDHTPNVYSVGCAWELAWLPGYQRVLTTPLLNPQSLLSNPQSLLSNPQSLLSNPQSLLSNPQSLLSNPHSFHSPSTRSTIMAWHPLADLICAAYSRR